MKLLLVGPGRGTQIPPLGWGAVEIVIWNYQLQLEKMGHQVEVLNQDGREAALLSRPWEYDVVHLHYDQDAEMWIALAQTYGFQLIVTTHFGYAPFPEHWDDIFRNTVQALVRAPRLLFINQRTKDNLLRAGASGRMDVLPNGVDTNSICFSAKGNGKALCLGRIEPRKRQFELAQLLPNCEFVGPLADARFPPHHPSYLGAWTRQEVSERLTEYSALVLPSSGEAQPLVVLEALAAGLSVVVSPEAAANLDVAKPFIYVEDFGPTWRDVVAQACQSNAGQRPQIRSYVEETFDWSVICAQYIELIQPASMDSLLENGGE